MLPRCDSRRRDLTEVPNVTAGNQRARSIDAFHERSRISFGSLLLVSDLTIARYSVVFMFTGITRTSILTSHRIFVLFFKRKGMPRSPIMYYSVEFLHEKNKVRKLLREGLRLPGFSSSPHVRRFLFGIDIFSDPVWRLGSR